MSEENGRTSYNWMPSVVRNVAFIGGSLMAFVGLWWERPSLALVVVGGLFAAVGAWSAWQASGVIQQVEPVDEDR